MTKSLKNNLKSGYPYSTTYMIQILLRYYVSQTRHASLMNSNRIEITVSWSYFELSYVSSRLIAVDNNDLFKLNR